MNKNLNVQQVMGCNAATKDGVVEEFTRQEKARVCGGGGVVVVGSRFQMEGYWTNLSQGPVAPRSCMLRAGAAVWMGPLSGWWE